MTLADITLEDLAGYVCVAFASIGILYFVFRAITLGCMIEALYEDMMHERKKEDEETKGLE